MKLKKFAVERLMDGWTDQIITAVKEHYNWAEATSNALKAHRDIEEMIDRGWLEESEGYKLMNELETWFDEYIDYIERKCDEEDE